MHRSRPKPFARSAWPAALLVLVFSMPGALRNPALAVDGQTFDDVPASHPLYPYIEALWRAGFTQGCSASPPLYCPDQGLRRSEMAVFMERSEHGADFIPPMPDPSQLTFADVPFDHWAVEWIDALWLDGYTAGCQETPQSLFCPERPHTRAEASVFALRMKFGRDYVPAVSSARFVDVPSEAWYFPWVHAAYSQGLLPACELSPALRFCPEAPLDRGWAAFMIVEAKGLPLPIATPTPTQTSSATPSPTATRTPGPTPTPGETACTPLKTCTVPLTFSQQPAYPYSFATGVPIPRGVLASLDALRLEDSAGREVPAQFESLSRWPDGTHKAVLVILSPPELAATGYFLQIGSGVSRSSYQTGLSVTEDAAAILVRTGKIQFQLNKSRFAVLDQAWIDGDGDGIYEESEKTLLGAGDLFLINAFDREEYTSSRFAAPRFSIEERGPVRVVIRAQGSLQSASGKTLTEFIVRLSAYAGRDYIQMDYTLVDPRPETDVRATRPQLALSAIGYGIRVPFSAVGASYAFGGEGGQVVRGALSGQHYLYQRGASNYVDGSLQPFDFAYEGAGSGQKAAGWVDVSGEQFGLTVIVRDFWQQFPKELSVSPGEMTIYLHPPRASLPNPDLAYPPVDPATKRYTRPNTFYFPREGGAKTYQVLLQLHAGKLNESATARLNASFQRPALLEAPASWYAGSGVFGDNIEAGPWSVGYDRYIMDEIYVPSISNKEATGGYAIPYGWRDYGDRMRAGWADVVNGVRIPSFYNDTHVGAENFLIQYLRTGDRRWWDLGERATRHWMDIDVSHTDRRGYWTDGNNALVGFGPGEGHMINHTIVDHSSRNIHWGHAHISGLPAYYLLTGDRRAYEVLREVADWWARAAPVFYATPIDNPHVAEAERDYAWPLYVLNEAYRSTGDQKYLAAGAQIVRHLVEWWQTPSDHIVGGQVVGRNDWTQGSGWWTMYPKEGNSTSESPSNGTNPWMAGGLLSAVIQFRDFDADLRLVERATIDEMLLQTMNYVVKFGWEESLRYRAYPYFVYSEANREYPGGTNHLSFPLAYLWNLERVQGSSHPQWYDTNDKWITIAKAEYEDWQIVKHRETISIGFYGYEMIYPADFFSLMKRLTDLGF